MVMPKYRHLTNTILLLLLCFFSNFSHARDLADVKADGVLRHIGIPYANFVIIYKEGHKTVVNGFDVELMKGFAKHLGVKYE